MDLYCRVCREPWDMDTLHEEVAARWPDKPWQVDGRHDQPTYERYYRQVSQDFTRRGCEALESYETPHNPATTRDTNSGPTTDATNATNATDADIDAVYELMGEDIDGAAATFDDFPDLFQ